MKTAFEADVTWLVKGRPEAGVMGLIQRFRAAKERFREAILCQAPDFKPYSQPPVESEDEKSNNVAGETPGPYYQPTPHPFLGRSSTIQSGNGSFSTMDRFIEPPGPFSTPTLKPDLAYYKVMGPLCLQ